jgi:hypothetical protein
MVNPYVPDDGKWHFSLGVGQHPQGPFFVGAVTSPSRWGGFFGHASEATSDSKKPPLGAPGASNYETVSVDRQSSTQLGVAYRFSRNAVLGLGYGTTTVEKYYSGVIPATQQRVRSADTKTTKDSGAVLMVDFGFRTGVGLQVSYGTSLGAAVTFRW